MSARCAILAHFVAGFEPAGHLMRCPTTPYRFHYHGTSGAYAPLTGTVPCSHRHQSVNLAVKCSERLRADQEAKS